MPDLGLPAEVNVNTHRFAPVHAIVSIMERRSVNVLSILDMKQ